MGRTELVRESTKQEQNLSWNQSRKHQEGEAAIAAACTLLGQPDGFEPPAFRSEGGQRGLETACEHEGPKTSHLADGLTGAEISCDCSPDLDQISITKAGGFSGWT